MLYIILMCICYYVCLFVCLFLLMTLPAVYFVFILYYNVRQKANSKQFLIQVLVIKKGRQLATSTSHMAQELLMNI